MISLLTPQAGVRLTDNRISRTTMVEYRWIFITCSLRCQCRRGRPRPCGSPLRIQTPSGVPFAPGLNGPESGPAMYCEGQSPNIDTRKTPRVCGFDRKSQGLEKTKS